MFVFLCVCVCGKEERSDIFLLWFYSVILVLSQGKAKAPLWYLCINLSICSFMCAFLIVSVTPLL